MKIVIIVIGILLMLAYLPPIFESWLHHRKYPILSNKVPHSILQRGDCVDMGNGRTYIFQGREHTNYDLVFQSAETIYDIIMTPDEFKRKVKSIKNKYGYKWIKQIEV